MLKPKEYILARELRLNDIKYRYYKCREMHYNPEHKFVLLTYRWKDGVTEYNKIITSNDQKALEELLVKHCHAWENHITKVTSFNKKIGYI